MIRMIIEGEPNKAEDIFWRSILRHSPQRYKMYFCHGNKGSYMVTRNLIDHLQIGDIVINALDKYAWDSYRKSTNLLKVAQQRCNFDLVMIGSNSFEGIFLSYKGLLPLVRIKNASLMPVIDDVATRLLQKQSIAPQLTRYAQYLRNAGLTPNIGTEERFIAWLLKEAARSPVGIRISKDQVGDCWLIDCCDAHPNTNRACPQGKTRRSSHWTKILDLEYNSVLHFNSQPLSRILHG